MQEETNILKIHDIYQHYKGNYYIVEDIATYSETNEPLILYRALYGDGKLWARPKSSFLSRVDPNKLPEGSAPIWRFTLQDSQDLTERK